MTTCHIPLISTSNPEMTSGQFRRTRVLWHDVDLVPISTHSSHTDKIRHRLRSINRRSKFWLGFVYGRYVNALINYDGGENDVRLTYRLVFYPAWWLSARTTTSRCLHKRIYSPISPPTSSSSERPGLHH